MKRKRKMSAVVLLIFLSALIVFVYMGNKSSKIIFSSVFSTSEKTEIHLYVQMNTLFNVDINMLTEEIIREHQIVNQSEGNVVYILHLYRTEWHYKRKCEYNTIKYDENGATICCQDYLGV